MVRLQQCPCGSGKFPEALYDGHSIFMCYACDDCKAEKLAGFRHKCSSVPPLRENLSRTE
jgi:hypothetical protein